jgi:hypothetical protein
MQLHRFFNGISMKTVAHLVQYSQARTVVDPSGENLVTGENLERPRGIPILLFFGKRGRGLARGVDVNDVYSAEGEVWGAWVRETAVRRASSPGLLDE